MFAVRPLVIVATASSLLITSRSRAQCTPDWVPGAAYPGLYRNMLHDTALWDPDGAGPDPELLVITGDFDAVGGVTANHIAAWDGTRWRPLGAGFGGPSSEGGIPEAADQWSYCVCVHNGALYAGQWHYVCDGAPRPRCFNDSTILRWDGAAWQPVVAFDGALEALATFDGELVAAGHFVGIDDVPARGIARWNGKAWRSLGDSPNDGVDDYVFDLLVYDEQLIVAGSFDTAGGVAARGVASWDGAQWHALGAGLGGEYYGVYTVGVYQDQIVAGGSFGAFSGDPEYVARWDGTAWQPLGSGTNDAVFALAVYSGELIVGGNFGEAGGQPADGIARWNGSEWRSMGSEVGQYPFVSALGVYQADLFAGGAFSSMHGVPAINIARWDGAAWHTIDDGLGGTVRALASHNNDLIAAGYLHSSCGTPLPGRIARWDGQCWNAMTTTHDPSGFRVVAAMTSYNSDLVVAGGFGSIDGVPATNIARWDGTQWHALGSGISDTTAWAPVSALVAYDGRLIAGGYFDTAGGAAANLVASWDGTQWQPLGDGLPGDFAFVSALVVYKGELFAGGGRFDFEGPLKAGVARWDPTTLAWEPILPLGGINDYISALVVYGDDLVAGGIVAAGESSTDFIPFVASWNGSEWRPLGALGPDPEAEIFHTYVGSLAVDGATLIAGGRFARADGAPANNIARWDGTQWHAMGAGLTFGFEDYDPYGSATVSSLVFHNGALAVGGEFLRAGDHPSAYFALWRCPTCPADFNADNRVNSQDFFDFLTAFFNANPAADFNADGAIDSQDYFDYLAAFFAPC